MIKRFLSFLLVLVMLCSMLVTTAWATDDAPANHDDPSNGTTDWVSEGVCGDNLTWTLDDNGVLTISGTGAMWDYDIQQLNYSPWSEVDDVQLRELVLGNGITHIGNYAFYFWPGSGNLILPNSITSIGKGAFYGAGFRGNLVIPDSVTTIGNQSFWASDFDGTLTIGTGVKSIGYGAFFQCEGFTGNLIIPDNVTEISPQVFSGCSGFNGSLTLSNNITVIPDWSFEYCSGLAGELVIPNVVTIIGSRAFEGTNFTGALVLPESLTEIHTYAFNLCRGFTGPLTIPGKVIEIQDYAFRDCDNLTEVFFEGDAPIIGSAVFSLSNPDYPQFDDMGELRTFTLHVPVGTSGWSVPVWNEYNTEWYSLRGSEEVVGGVLRSGEGWSINWTCEYDENDIGEPTDVKLTIYLEGNSDSSDLSIAPDNGNFPWEASEYEDLKNAITEIEIRGLAWLTLHIPAYSFQEYDALTRVTLIHVSGIDGVSFTGCDELQTVDISGEFTSFGSDVFKDCTKLSSVYFPISLQYINSGAFQNTALGTVELYENIVSIRDSAFDGCENLRIRCWEDSEAHYFAVWKNIPFEFLNAFPTASQIYYEENGQRQTEAFLYNLEDYVSGTSSTEYSPQLAHMLAAISCAAYNEEFVTDSLLSLGFETVYTKYTAGSIINYSFGKMQMQNGKQLVLVTIQGTVGDLVGGTQWGSNFTLGTEALFGAGLHEGFSEAMNIVYMDLLSFLDNNLSNTVFVTTGHSRGAAASNLLAVKLQECGVMQNNIYSYNFACPDVASASGYSWNMNGIHDSIFNIGHAGDVVPVIPGKIGNLVGIGGSLYYQWGKFGRSYWWAFDWADPGELVYDLTFASHDMTLYLRYMRRENTLNSYLTWEETQFV